MKKAFLTLLLVLAGLAQGWAQEFTYDGITYNITSTVANTVEVIAGSTKYSGDISIPTEVVYNGISYRVTAIGKSAFYTCFNLKSVTLPNSVTSIGNNAFFWCKALTSVVIPNSVTNIGEDAFYSCRALTSITIPNFVKSIGGEAFSECYALTSIYSCIINPFVMSTTVFDYVDKQVCTLYVPRGTKAAYESTKEWKDFQNIVEFDATAIEEVATTDGTIPITAIYNLGGQKVTRTAPGHVYLYRHADGTTRKQMAR